MLCMLCCCCEHAVPAVLCCAAFRKAMLGMARSVGANFVVVDMGPHTDVLHKVLA